MRMPEPTSKPQPSPQDDWGTTTRQGYEDRPFYQPPKQAPPKRKGSRVLRTLGGLLVVAGIFWATYVATSTGGWRDLLRPGFPSRPVLVLAVGLLVLLLEKLFR